MCLGVDICHGVPVAFAPEVPDLCQVRTVVKSIRGHRARTRFSKELLPSLSKYVLLYLKTIRQAAFGVWCSAGFIPIRRAENDVICLVVPRLTGIMLAYAHWSDKQARFVVDVRCIAMRNL